MSAQMPKAAAAACTVPEHRALAERAAALHGLHVVAQRLHSSLDWTSTLDAVATGVVEATGFEIAAVNLRAPDGMFDVVALAGPQEVHDALLGKRIPASVWTRMLAKAEPLGTLRFLDHRVGVDADMYVYVPDIPASDDPEAWDPNDALFAPLTSSTGELIGALSVDLPVTRRRPGPVQRELLEIFAAQAQVAIDHARVHLALKQREAALEHAATHDALTGLANRALLTTRAAQAARVGQAGVAMLVVDLDRFKAVNDGYGHLVGDEVLAVGGARLHSCVREGDTVARTGGDEFVLLLRGQRLREHAQAVVERLQAALAQPVLTSRGLLRISASVGVAVGDPGQDPDELLVLADDRMYEMKRVHQVG